MKSMIHSTLGLFASLLSFAGFYRIADRVDTFISGLPASEMDKQMLSVIPCARPCEAVFGEQA